MFPGTSLFTVKLIEVEVKPNKIKRKDVILFNGNILPQDESNATQSRKSLL